VHKNARLTPKGREVMLARLQAGQHQADVAQAMAVSLTTLKKWQRRYREEGTEGLEDRSSRPRHSPRQLPARLRERVVVLRRKRRTGRYIARQLGLSAASVSRILRCVHLSRWRELEPRAPANRYERAEPGELIHLDIKKLGRIKGFGHRITGHHSRVLRNRGIGWDFVHVAIDDASRIALADVADDEFGHTASGLFRSAVERYRRRGIRVQRVMTDNGAA
jgi:transposase